MNQNFPNREPVIIHDQELHVVRRLPSNAEVKDPHLGARINGDHVIARADPRHLAVHQHCRPAWRIAQRRQQNMHV